MAGCIVQVWFEPESEHNNGRGRFKMIETEMPDFSSVCQMIDADRLIGGAILWTKRTHDGAQLITERQPCAFRGAAVMRIELPRWRFVEDGE